MAIQIQAIMTTKGREALAKSFGGTLGAFPWSHAAYFKIGSSGYETINGQRVPKTPDASYTNIESQGSNVFWYKKTLVSSDVLFLEPASIQFRCFLDLAEGNGDLPDTAATADGPKSSSSLNNQVPTFFEVGLFDSNDNMIAYGTFPEETKLSNKTLNHLVTLNF